MQKTQRVRAAAIAINTADSDQIDLSGVGSIVVVIPAVWTAAGLTFRVSPDGGANFYPVYDEAGGELTVLSANVAPGRAIALSSLALQAMSVAAPLLIIRSGTAAAPVNQAAARVLTVILGG